MPETLSLEFEAKRDQIYSLGTEAHICLSICTAILLYIQLFHILLIFKSTKLHTSAVFCCCRFYYV